MRKHIVLPSFQQDMVQKLQRLKQEASKIETRTQVCGGLLHGDGYIDGSTWSPCGHGGSYGAVS